MRQEGVRYECDARLTGNEIGGFSAYHKGAGTGPGWGSLRRRFNDLRKRRFKVSLRAGQWKARPMLGALETRFSLKGGLSGPNRLDRGRMWAPVPRRKSV